MPKINELDSLSDMQGKVEQFLYLQAEVLDERRWDEWLNLFTDDGIYWMPASTDQETGVGQPNIFYEDYHLMDMRIRRVEHPYAHSQAAGHRTTYRLDDQRYFGGRYTHRLKTTDSGYKIKLQRVDLVNVEGPFDYVMQVWV